MEKFNLRFQERPVHFLGLIYFFFKLYNKNEKMIIFQEVFEVRQT